MKTYVCDSCKRIIDDPYELRMKEFSYVATYDCGMCLPDKMKCRKKIHLCGKCFESLKYIAEKKRGAE